MDYGEGIINIVHCVPLLPEITKSRIIFRHFMARVTMLSSTRSGVMVIQSSAEMRFPTGLIHSWAQQQSTSWHSSETLSLYFLTLCESHLQLAES